MPNIGHPLASPRRRSRTTPRELPQKQLDLISQDPTVTRETLGKAHGITHDGGPYDLRKLQEAGLLRRFGPDKGGHWEAVTPDEDSKR